MFTLLAALMVVAGVLLAGLAASAARRGGPAAGTSLAVLLLAVAWWGFASAIELSATAATVRELWGDLKYAGVATVAPAWLVFVLRYTNRGHLVSRRLMAALAIEPVLVMVALLTPATHDLVRSYPPSVAAGELPFVATGPLFWVHFTYVNAVLLTATAMFVVSMVRVSRLYLRTAVILVCAALLPWTANVLHNFAVGPFARVDLTPFAFVVTGGVLFWGLFRQRLVNIAPVARHVVVETMDDVVLVLDPFGRVVDANPAAARTLGRRRNEIVGRPLADLLPGYPGQAGHDPDETWTTPLTLPVDGTPRHFDARRQPLPDRGGGTAGELLVLRDVTERMVAEDRLRQVLAERTRIADALQTSLLPAELPQPDGLRVAARFRPAGDGREIGGDFYDVFPLDSHEWGVVLGDVSGKGAEAAAVTALVRYTLRALAALHRSPREVLAAVNTALLGQGTQERFCTLVYAVVRPQPGGLHVRLCLGGHHQPLLARADGRVEAVGRFGTALGLFDEPELHDVVVELGPADLLCLFTDGLVEARDGDRQFGADRAAEVLALHREAPPDAVGLALERAARAFGGRDLVDDLAIVVLQVVGTATAPAPAAEAPTAQAGAHIAAGAAFGDAAL